LEYWVAEQDQEHKVIAFVNWGKLPMFNLILNATQLGLSMRKNYMLIDMRSMYIHKLEKGKFGSIVLKEIPAGGSIVCKVRPYDEALGTMIHKEKSVQSAAAAISYGTEPGATVASSATYLASE